MGLNVISLEMLDPYLGGSVLSLGYPELSDSDGRIEDIIEKKGGTFACVDIFQHQGFEIICDLNQPVRFVQHDLVIDPGTLEHCFNIGQAFMNAAGAVKLGGRIFHGSPMSMLNHGFYNLNPTLFGFFYQSNGFEIERIEARSMGGIGNEIPMRLHARFAGDGNSAIYCLAKRIEEKTFMFPTQNKYTNAKQYSKRV